MTETSWQCGELTLISTTRKLLWHDLAICRDRKNLLPLMFCFGASRLFTSDCLAKGAHALAFYVDAFLQDRVCGQQQIHPQSALILVVADLLPSRRNHPVSWRIPLLASFGPDAFIFAGLSWMGLCLPCMHHLDNLLVGSRA